MKSIRVRSWSGYPRHDRCRAGSRCRPHAAATSESSSTSWISPCEDDAVVNRLGAMHRRARQPGAISVIRITVPLGPGAICVPAAGGLVGLGEAHRRRCRSRCSRPRGNSRPRGACASAARGHRRARSTCRRRRGRSRHVAEPPGPRSASLRAANAAQASGVIATTVFGATTTLASPWLAATLWSSSTGKASITRTQLHRAVCSDADGSRMLAVVRHDIGRRTAVVADQNAHHRARQPQRR